MKEWSAMMIRGLFAILCAASIAAAQGVSGEAVYKLRCASCHDGASPRVPPKAALQRLSAARILRTLDFGTMISVGYLLKRDEREAVAKYLGTTGNPTGAPRTEALCRDRTVRVDNSGWNGWSPGTSNTRFQPNGALTLDQTRQLKLKWAFGFDGDVIAFSQPTVLGGNVFVGSASGQIHALDAKTGCTKWMFQADGPVRAALVSAPVGNRHALLFGDQIGWFYSVEAESGKLLWRKKVEQHESTRLTGAAAVNNGIAYIPVASWEETRALNDNYACCTFRGSVVALRVQDGSQVWKTYVIRETPKLLGKNSVGAEEWGPSGAGIWSAPTIDTKRGLLYVTTGDNYSEPATDTSDAVLALRMSNGQIVWSKQTTPNDVFNGYCYSRRACPGPDYDYGSSALLVTANGRDLVLAGQKSGVVYALDPDKGGALVWEARVGKGGVNGGVQWGMAADSQKVYAANSDVGRSEQTNPDPNDPRPVPFDRKQGGGLTALRLNDGQRAWYAPPPVCGDDAKVGCSPAQSSAVTAIPGVIFSGALDGHLRAYSAEDGRILWDFDTARDFQTVNGVRANGGAIDGPGAVIVGGMVFVNSGYARTGGMAGNVLLAFGPEE